MAKGAGRRAELLATAAEVFASRGYAATTVREVADAAGILAGSLYYHFDSKESMADEILRTFLEDLWNAYDQVTAADLDAAGTLSELVRVSFAHIERHRPAVVIYQNESKHLAAGARFGYLRDYQGRFEAMWRQVLDRGVKDGTFRAELDTSLIYRFIRDTVWTAAGWFQPGGRLPADDIATQYLAMVLDGIRGESDAL